MRPEPLCWLNDARGIFIPRDFANSFSNRARDVTGVSDEDWQILEAGPDHEHYWEAWDDVLRDAVVTNMTDGTKYRVYQEGDCWLIPVGMEWSEATDWFVWPQQETEDA